MNPQDCKKFEEHVEAYTDGLLSEGLSIFMDKHRAVCPQCARMAKAHSVILKSLRETKPLKAPAGLADNILAQIAAAEKTVLSEIPATEAIHTAPVKVPVFDCGTFEEHIAAYVDGILDKNLQVAMNEHRATCSACDRKAKIHELVLTSLNKTEPVKAPAGLYNRILAAARAYDAETAGAFRFVHKSWAAAVLIAATGSFLTALIPLYKYISAKSQDFRIPTLPENAVSLDPVKTHVTAWLIQLYSLFAQSQTSVYLHRLLSFAVEPVQLPMLSFAVPVYYFAAFALLSVTAWYYLSYSDSYGYSTSSI
ncbi:MAG: hypothetical protein JXB48_11335 [Candidatus Latescibacteria bacterium]|nr:hypothetical protein [Candidatus Latescibacterota bacterium]